MLSFAYSARDIKTGEKIEATVEAESEGAAVRLLTERGLAPIEIKPFKDPGSGKSVLNRVPTKLRVVFSRQLATLVNAGLPLVQSLSTVRGQTTNKTLKFVVGKIINDVEAGASLSDAMAKNPKIFNEVYTALIAAGEASGTLDVSLTRLADQEEKNSETVGKLKGAMVYPLIVIVVLIGVVIFMMTSVLPQVEQLYTGLPGAKLPLVTQILLNMAHFMTKYWWMIVGTLGIGGFVTFRWIHTPPGRKILDRIKMHAPAIGPLFMKVYMARFSRTASTLVASGVPLIQVLDTTAKSIGNVHVEESIAKAIEQVRGGKALSEALSGDKNFLELVPNMIHIGEQSGSLDGMLAKLADYYEKEVDNQIKSVSTIIEPLLMVVVGIIAMVVVAAVLLPIYSLAGKNFIHQ